MVCERHRKFLGDTGAQITASNKTRFYGHKVGSRGVGINLVVYRRRRGRIVSEASLEQWDWTRYVGDSEFAKDVLGDEVATIAEREDGYDGEWYYRPRDVARWKAWDAAYQYNNGRWSALADLLETDTELWVYQSV